MPITDNRTLLSNADTVTGWVTNGSITADAEIFYEGAGSISTSMSNAERYVLFNAGAAQNWSNNHFFFLVNCGIVGRLLTKAAGGFKVRFTGPLVTNFFEVYVGGSNSWPASFAGGWTLFVVDIETARSTAVTNGWVGGTPPATTAIQHVGIAAVTGAMTRNVANTWVDAIYRLPDGSAGILVTERAAGPTNWKWSDILSTADAGTWATVRQGAGGAYVCSVPIQFGNTTAALTHGFSDSNVTILWDAQEFAATDFYGFNVVNAATSTNNFTAGIKSGIADAATGQQGWTVQASSTGVRWYFDGNDPNITSIGLYGCQFNHGSLFNLENSALETISTFFIDCQEVVQSLGAESSLFLRNSVVNAATLDGVAFLKTANLTDVKYSNFSFSDGHAIQITTLGAPASFSSTENLFTGYGAIASNDAAIYNNSGRAVTINVSGGSVPTYRNGTSATTTIVATVSITISGLKDNTEVRVYTSEDNVPPYVAPTELAGIENATAGSTDNRSFSFSATPGNTLYIRVFNTLWIADDVTYLVPGSNATIQIPQRRDRVYLNS